ncbi:MAG TPA: Mu-like prophage major head subunit gpT family protein, partial [Phycisphaerae bacterium]|nr:Mu-like prophage major head subunit gpT family protein [Phycisphaerae bacterium]
DAAAAAADRGAAASGKMIHAAAAPAIVPLTATAEIAIEAAADGKPAKRPTFSIAAYSGGLLRVSAFYDPVVCDLTGLRAGPGGLVTVLKDHDSSQIVGQGKAVITATGVSVAGTVTGQYDDPSTPAGQVIAQHRGGFVWSASVGVAPERVERVQAGAKVTVNGKEFSGPLNVVRAGRLGEVSFVAIGADESARANIAASAAGRKTMSNESNIVGEIDPIQAERQRVSAIQALHTEFGKNADFGSITAKAVSEGWTPQAAELHLLRHSRPGVPNINTGGNGRISDTTVLAAAAMLHMSPNSAERAYGAQIVERAADLRIRSLRDLCAACVRAELGTIPVGDGELIRAAVSTASFANVLSDVSSKEALVQFNAAPSAWRQVCRRVSVKDFKPHRMVRMLLAGKFEPVSDAGEIKHFSGEDQAFDVSADTAGRMFGLTRKDIVNDDAGALLDTARIVGRKGAQHLSRQFALAILGNANAFFSESNGNLSEGAGTALSVASLTAALTNMRNRKDADGESLDLSPTVLLVPPSLEMLARALMVDGALARYTSSTKDSQPEANPLAGLLTLAVEPRLENSTYAGSSALAWYLWSQASDGGICAAFLNGQESPVVEQVELPSNVLGVAFRGYLDSGITLADPSAAYRAKGEA